MKPNFWKRSTISLMVFACFGLAADRASAQGFGGAQGIGAAFGGGGNPFGGGGGNPLAGLGGGGGRGGNARVSSSVVAVADEYSNSLIISGTDEQMDAVDKLIKELDQQMDPLTMLKVFRLQHADPQETADLLTRLFPDPTASNNGGRGGGGGFNPFGGFVAVAGGGGNAAANQGRAMKQAKVISVPDLRTRSLIVSASEGMMEQIDKIIKDLDSDNAGEAKPHTIDVSNMDPAAVAQILQSIYPTRNGLRTTTGNTQRGGTGTRTGTGTYGTGNRTGGAGTGGGAGRAGGGGVGGAGGGTTFGGF